MVGFVLAQDPAQVGLVPDESSVQELAPASADPAFGYRVFPRRQLRPIPLLRSEWCG
jgi:hypothetical protein